MKYTFTVEAETPEEIAVFLRDLGKTPQQVAADNNGPSKTVKNTQKPKAETQGSAPATETPAPVAETQVQDSGAEVTIEMVRKAVQEKTEGDESNVAKVKAIFAECNASKLTELQKHQYKFAYEKITAL